MTLLTAPPVVVGYDGTPTSRAALMVAAGEAVRRRRNLLIVHAEDDSWDLVRAGQEGRDPLAAAVDLVRPVISRSRVSLLDRIGPAASVLVEQAEHAELLVVGRGDLGLLARIAGSVATEVACDAPCPVLIVGDPGPHVPRGGPVVAGVDREHAVEVLEAAFREAELRRSELVVVHSWKTMHWLGPDGLVTVDANEEVLREQHLQWLHEVVAPFQSKYPAVAVTEVPREGRAAAVLTEASGGACLVVVGTRGHGPAAGMVLGSIGQKLLRHALCPVLVVRSHAS